jgi:hypothetical protein
VSTLQHDLQPPRGRLHRQLEGGLRVGDGEHIGEKPRPTSTANEPKARPPAKPSAASNATSPAASGTSCSRPIPSYSGWRIALQFIYAKGSMPKEVALPRAPEREVARALYDRRRFPAVEVIEALIPLAQPHLLQTDTKDASLALTRGTEVETQAVIAPVGKSG